MAAGGTEGKEDVAVSPDWSNLPPPDLQAIASFLPTLRDTVALESVSHGFRAALLDPTSTRSWCQPLCFELRSLYSKTPMKPHCLKVDHESVLLKHKSNVAEWLRKRHNRFYNIGARIIWCSGHPRWKSNINAIRLWLTVLCNDEKSCVSRVDILVMHPSSFLEHFQLIPAETAMEVLYDPIRNVPRKLQFLGWHSYQPWTQKLSQQLRAVLHPQGELVLAVEVDHVDPNAFEDCAAALRDISTIHLTLGWEYSDSTSSAAADITRQQLFSAVAQLTGLHSLRLQMSDWPLPLDLRSPSAPGLTRLTLSDYAFTELVLPASLLQLHMSGDAEIGPYAEKVVQTAPRLTELALPDALAPGETLSMVLRTLTGLQNLKSLVLGNTTVDEDPHIVQSLALLTQLTRLDLNLLHVHRLMEPSLTPLSALQRLQFLKLPKVPLSLAAVITDNGLWRLPQGEAITVAHAREQHLGDAVPFKHGQQGIPMAESAPSEGTAAGPPATTEGLAGIAPERSSAVEGPAGTARQEAPDADGVLAGDLVVEGLLAGATAATVPSLEEPPSVVQACEMSATAALSASESAGQGSPVDGPSAAGPAGEGPTVQGISAGAIEDAANTRVLAALRCVVFPFWPQNLADESAAAVLKAVLERRRVRVVVNQEDAVGSEEDTLMDLDAGYSFDATDDPLSICDESFGEPLLQGQRLSDSA